MSSTSGNVAIVGGGVIGAMCAWYLRKLGYEVTVLERRGFGDACSHGNCGYVCPSHVLPLAIPGAVTSTLRAMLRPNSPFSIRMRMSPALWKWMLRFSLRCNRKDMLESAAGLHPLLQSSLQLYHELVQSEAVDCEWEERGLLFVFHSERDFQAYSKVDQMLGEHVGLTAKPYDSTQLVELEPALKTGLGGAWHYEDDCHLRPDKLMCWMKQALKSQGVTIRENYDVKRFELDGTQVRAVTDGSEAVEANQFVLATGSWAPFLSEYFGRSIPIQPGKGYSLTMPKPQRVPRIPMIFEEHRVAVTPFQTGYRIGSTMEFAGYDTTINRRRLDLLKAGAEHYLHDPYHETVEEEWYGWRPMTWDSKPIIDRSERCDNLWIAAGHSMLGLTLATGTGKLLSELMSGTEPHVDPRPFALRRF